MGKKDTPPFEVPGALLPAAAPRLRPSKVEPFQEYNERTITAGCAGGQRDFDVPGQQTPLDGALHMDLLPNERILRQFDVNFRMQVSLLRKIIWTVCMLCRACLSKPIFHARRRIAITTQGRIGFFSSDLQGVQEGNICMCIKGGMTCSSNVTVKWYHASELSALQFFVGQEHDVCPPWRIFCRDPYAVSLRLWFHKYPALGQMNAGGAGFIRFARTAQPAKKFKANVARNLFESLVGGARGFIAHCFPGGAEFLNAGGAGIDLSAAFDAARGICDYCKCDFVDPADTLPYPGSAAFNQYAIEIVSGRGGGLIDELHPDKDEQENSMRALYETIVQISSPTKAGDTAAAPVAPAREAKVTTGPLAHFTGGDDGNAHFNIVHQNAVLLDRSGSGLPVVNVESRHLMPGEQVIDAIPYQQHQGWMEFLMSCCNVCCMCPPAFNGAMILTSHRIISIFVDSASAAKGDGSNRKGGCGGLCDATYLYSMESLNLGDKGFQEGILGLGEGDASLLIRTKFGGIKVSPQLRARFPWQCAINRNIRTRARLFLSNFVSKKNKQVLATPPPGFNAGVPEDIQQVLPLMAGESFVATMRTEGLYLNLADNYNPCTAVCTCGSDAALVRLVRCCTCGCKPLEHVAHVVLTTHRVLAVGFPENAPWFLKTCCTKKSLIVYWQPLANMPGFEVNAGMFVDQSCMSRICSCLPCFSPAVADVTVDTAGLGGFPVPVQRYLSSTNEGILDEPQVSVLRRALSLVTAAPGIDPSVNLAALPGTAPPQVAPGAGSGAQVMVNPAAAGMR